MNYSNIKDISKMRLQGDRLLVLKDKPEEKSAGGLFLPGEPQNDPIAKVISVGPDVEKIDVVSGDYIMHVAYAGQAFKIGGDEYIVLQEAEVIGVLS